MRRPRTLPWQRPPEDAPEADEQRAPQRCLACGADLRESRSFERYRVCHACEFHFHLTAHERAALLLDPGSFHEDDRGITSIDPLSFVARRSYRSRVIAAQRRTGLTESVLTGTGSLAGRDVVIAVLDFAFLGGSMGVVAGERLARAFEKAASRKAPIITVASTSGTRMEEGLFALMQSPRIIVAARRHHRLGLPHISILTNPATGPAYAGFVRLADFTLSEPRALVGYTAKRVLEETERQELPEGAHTAESHLRHGLIDAIVPRPQLRDSVVLLLDLFTNDYRLTASREQRVHKDRHSHRGAWQLVQLSRHHDRPNAQELIAHMTNSFVEIRGDRAGGEDPSVIAGIGTLGGEAMLFIGQNRPHEPKNDSDGWILASGFRKARRAIELAAKFQLPIVTLIDTAGAYPSLANEEAGLGHAIAHCTAAMLEARVPTVAVITGEGNSEAAVAMAVADRVLMLDNAIYEVIRPEDAAQILLQEQGRASEMAERLRITSHDCLKLGIIDATVAEPGDGAHTDHAEAAQLLRRSIIRELTALSHIRAKRRLDDRYSRYRQYGSTHSKLRGRLERRMAHLIDRGDALITRLRRKPGNSRSQVADYTDFPL
jgi:acetyl-CoA carboxylase carboxyl transferase subunit beta